MMVNAIRAFNEELVGVVAKQIPCSAVSVTIPFRKKESHLESSLFDELDAFRFDGLFASPSSDESVLLTYRQIHFKRSLCTFHMTGRSNSAAFVMSYQRTYFSISSKSSVGSILSSPDINAFHKQFPFTNTFAFRLIGVSTFPRNVAVACNFGRTSFSNQLSISFSMGLSFGKLRIS